MGLHLLVSDAGNRRLKPFLVLEKGEMKKHQMDTIFHVLHYVNDSEISAYDLMNSQRKKYHEYVTSLFHDLPDTPDPHAN